MQMQNNNTTPETAKMARAQSWLANCKTPEQQKNVHDFCERMNAQQVSNKDHFQKLRAMMADLSDYGKNWLGKFTDLLDQWQADMEGANESLAERFNIEKVICASDPEESELPPFPSDFPADRMAFVRGLKAHMQADVIEEIMVKANRPHYPLRHLLPGSASEELLEYIAGLDPTTTAEQFVGECTDPFILLLAARDTNVPADIIEENEDAIEKMTAAEACEHMRESGLGGCIVTNLLSL
jgi:hypothetical protein